MCQRLEEQLHGIQGKEFNYIRDSLKHIVFELNVEERGMKAMASCLRDAAKAYENGKIDIQIYEIIKSILSGLRSFVIASLQEFLTGIIQDKSAEAIADAMIAWLRENTTFFMNRGYLGALVQRGTSLITQTPSLLASLIRGGAKYGVPIVGTLLDYSIQVFGGEKSDDALIKAGAHTAIGFGAAAAGTAFAGTAAGAKVGALIGTIIPGAGTLVGVIVGAVIGTVGTVVFDYVYDNWDNIMEGAGNLIDTAGDWISSAGNAVTDEFQGLGSVFG